MSDEKDYSGRAALTICESLLLALNDHKLLSKDEIVGVLRDSASLHEQAAGLGEEGDVDRAVVKIIKRIIDDCDAMRSSGASLDLSE